MNITMVVGSHRKNSESHRVANVLSEHYLSDFNKVYMHNLAELKLPFWDEGIWEGEERWNEILAPIYTDIMDSDAFIVITPEWSGMAPPMLKNYFLLSDQEIMRHKPALIVSVSSGMGGAYPVSELRSSSYKNTKLCYIPDHLILRNIEYLFKGLDEELDEEIDARVEFSCNLLFSYAKALVSVRKENFPFDQFAYGM